MRNFTRVVCLVFCLPLLAACNGGGGDAGSTTPTKPDVAPVIQPIENPTPTPTATPTVEPTPTPSNTATATPELTDTITPPVVPPEPPVVPELDSDHDGMIDANDNCPNVANADQLDSDNNHVGDACDQVPAPPVQPPIEDVDTDHDSIIDAKDNCPNTWNADQLDSDADQIGDVCDSDADGDTIEDAHDNCLALANQDQHDLDHDSLGDLCDGDIDGDGLINSADQCPTTASLNAALGIQEDIDHDGTPDECDDDRDGDGVSNASDNCVEKANPDQLDSDVDKIGDVCDDDTDGDGVKNVADNCETIANPTQADTNNNTKGDACDDADIVNPTITAVVPAPGATDVSTTPAITITTSEPVQYINASVYKKGSATAIAQGSIYSQNNDVVTALKFTPDNPLAYSTTYQIKVASKDPTGNPLPYEYTWEFTTLAPPPDTTPPHIVNLQPALKATNIPVNTIFTVTFDKELDANTVNAQSCLISKLSNDAEGHTQKTPLANVVVTYLNKTISLQSVAPLEPNATYVIELKNITDLAGNLFPQGDVWNVATVSQDNTKDTTPPSVTGSTPADGAKNVATTADLQLQFSETINSATLSSDTIALTAANGPVVATTMVAAENGQVTITPDTTLEPGTLYTLHITTGVQDLAGNALAKNVDVHFTTQPDTTPISVASTSPTADAIDVNVQSAVQVTFSENVKPESVNAATFFVTLAGDTKPLAGAVTVKDNVATFTPSVALADTKTYRATLTTGTTDKSGNALAQAMSWNFSTPKETIPPTLVGRVPAPGGANLPLDTKIVATFSEPLDAKSVNADALTLTFNTQKITGTSALSADGTQLTFTPAAPLHYFDASLAEQYRVLVNETLTDLAGNVIVGGNTYTWYFQTIAPPAPIVVDKTPVGTAVPVTTPITLTFNEAIDPTSVSANNFTFGQFGNHIAGQVTVQGNTVTLTPQDKAFSANQQVIVGVSKVKSVQGGEMDTLYTWSFTTLPTAPSITNTTPVANSIVPLTPEIYVTFKQVIDPASVALPGAVHLVRTADNAEIPISAQASNCDVKNVCDKIIITQPANAQLDVGSEYRVTVTSLVKDVFGQALPAPFSWTFTTVAAPIVTPLDNAQLVPIDTVISVKFSDGLQLGTNGGGNTLTTLKSPADVVTLHETVTGNSITGSATFNAANATLQFKPTTPLAYKSTYELAIAPLQNISGKILSPSRITHFTTAPNPDQTPPKVMSITPASGETQVSATTQVSVTFSEPIVDGDCYAGLFSITELGNNSNVSCNAAHTAMTLTGNFQFGTLYHVTLKPVHDAAGNASVAKSWSFTIEKDPAGPKIGYGSYSPTGQTPTPIDTKLTVHFPTTMDAQSFAKPGALTLSVVTTTLPKGPTPGAIVPITFSYDVAATMLTVTPSAALDYATTYKMALSSAVTDDEGHPVGNNAGVGTSWEFTTVNDPIAFAVTSITPANGTTKVPVESAVTITFSKPLYPPSVSAANVQITTGGTPVSGVFDFKDSSITFTPTTKLSNSTPYNVVLKDTVQSLSGMPLTLFNASFTTIADTKAPTILSTTPKDVGTDVGIVDQFAVTFDEPLPLSIDNISGQITALSGEKITVNLFRQSDGKTYQAAAKEALTYNTKYQWQITTKIIDQAGNAIATNPTWSFTTAQEPLTLVSSWPEPNATNVGTNQSLLLLFNRAVDATAISGNAFKVQLNGSTATVAGTVSFNNRTLLFKPSAAWQKNSTYKIILSDPKTPLILPFTTGAGYDLTKPRMTMISPQLNAKIAPSEAVLMLFTKAIDPSSVTSTTVKISSPLGTTAGTLSAFGNAVKFAPTTPWQLGTTYKVQVAAFKDMAGNGFTEDYAWTFQTNANVATTQPTITRRGNIQPSSNAMLAVEASSMIDPETMTPTALRVFDANNNFPAGVLKYAGTYLLWKPLTTFPSSITLQLVGNALKDMRGQVLPATKWPLTINSNADVTAPTITNPTTIQTYYSMDEVMDPTTVNSATMTLTREDGLPVKGLVTYSGGACTALGACTNWVATFTPFAPLEIIPNLKVYTLGLSTGARDLAGNALAKAASSGFQNSGSSTTDADKDGLLDTADNCPLIANPKIGTPAAQPDSDGDGFGDACDYDADNDGTPNVSDTDSDNDGILNASDNCPTTKNADQKDTDKNGVGDACDYLMLDTDKDGVPDLKDNCPQYPNADQKDLNNNGIGDVCENLSGPNSDGDVIPDAKDNCPFTTNPDQKDTDGDGIGDACDKANDKITGADKADDDWDGIPNSTDNCPKVANPTQTDGDKDGLGDACDTVVDKDTDVDGLVDAQDNCPAVYNPFQEDGDANKIGDACDMQLSADLLTQALTKVTTIAGESGGSGKAYGALPASRLSGSPIFAADSKYAYVADPVSGVIYRGLMNTTSGALELLRFGGAPNVSSMVVIDQYLYVGYQQNNGAGLQAIGRFPLATTTKPTMEVWYTLSTGSSGGAYSELLSPHVAAQGKNLLVFSWGKVLVLSTSTAQTQLATWTFSGGAVGNSVASMLVRGNVLYLADPTKGVIWQINLGQSPFMALKLSTVTLAQPYGLALLPGDSSMIITDAATNTLYTYEFATQKLTLTGQHGTAPVDGTWDKAKFVEPRNVIVTAGGIFYVGDQITIRAGIVFGATTVAGKVAHAGFQSGVGNAARFTQLQHVAWTADGNTAYVVERMGSTPNVSDLITKVTFDAQGTATVGVAAALVDPSGKPVMISDLAIDPLSGKIFVSIGDTLLYVVMPTDSTSGLPNVTSYKIPLGFTYCGDKKFANWGYQIAFDSAGRFYSWVGAKVLTDNCPTEPNASLGKLIMATGFGQITLSGTTLNTSSVQANTINLSGTKIDTKISYGALSDMTATSSAPGVPQVSLAFAGSTNGIEHLQVDVAQKKITNSNTFIPPNLPTNPTVAIVGGTLYISGTNGAQYGQKATHILRLDPVTGVSAIVSGSDQQSVRDGQGALGWWNNIADMAYDAVHQRILVLDAGENVLRFLQK